MAAVYLLYQSSYGCAQNSGASITAAPAHNSKLISSDHAVVFVLLAAAGLGLAAYWVGNVSRADSPDDED